MSSFRGRLLLTPACWTALGLADLTGCEERLTPCSLADILQRYLRDGPPAEPTDEEVLVD